MLSESDPRESSQSQVFAERFPRSPGLFLQQVFPSLFFRPWLFPMPRFARAVAWNRPAGLQRCSRSAVRLVVNRISLSRRSAAIALHWVAPHSALYQIVAKSVQPVPLRRVAVLQFQWPRMPAHFLKMIVQLCLRLRRVALLGGGRRTKSA